MLLRALVALLLTFAAGSASAQTLVGVAAPLTGPFALLGVQVRDGATVAAERTGAEIALIDDQCTAAGGLQAAQEFVSRRVAMVVGFLCGEALEAALPVLKDAGIPVITVGVRTNSLTDNREKTGFPIYRLAPRADGEATAISEIIPDLWRERQFAIIDDGTIYGRDLADALRGAVERRQLRPAFIDVYRPQLDNQIGLIGRLRRAGADRVFVGGDRDDIAIMTRDSAYLEAGIGFAGGEALRGISNGVPLATGTIMVALPEWSEIADPAVISAFGAENIMADGFALPTYAAIEIVAAATNGGVTGIGLFARLDEDEFNTAIGPIRFDAKGDLTRSLYRAYSFDGSRFVPMAAE